MEYIHGKTLRHNGKAIREVFEDLFCKKSDVVAALRALRHRRLPTATAPEAGKFWAIRCFRQEAQTFFTRNRSKMPAKWFEKMLGEFSGLAYVTRAEWLTYFGTTFFPRAYVRGHYVRAKYYRNQAKDQVLARFDELSREHPETFCMALSGRPGEILGSLFLQKKGDRYDTTVTWATETLRRGLGFVENLCHPHNIHLQRTGRPIVLTTDVLSAVQLQVFYQQAFGVPPLVAVLPPTYLKLKHGTPLELPRYPFFTDKIIVHGSDAAFVKTAASAFGGQPVCTNRDVLSVYRDFYTRFPTALLRTMRTGALPPESLQHH
jgi:hypothetical protein